MEVELDKYRAACKGKLDEATIGLVLKSVQANVGTVRSASVTIASNNLVVTASDHHEFNGDAPPKTDSSGDGVLRSANLDNLYKNTTCYTLTPGVVAKIEFKDDGDTVLGTWQGTLQKEPNKSFTFPGTWS